VKERGNYHSAEGLKGNTQVLPDNPRKRKKRRGGEGVLTWIAETMGRKNAFSSLGWKKEEERGSIDHSLNFQKKARFPDQAKRGEPGTTFSTPKLVGRGRGIVDGPNKREKLLSLTLLFFFSPTGGGFVSRLRREREKGREKALRGGRERRKEKRKSAALDCQNRSKKKRKIFFFLDLLENR